MIIERVIDKILDKKKVEEFCLDCAVLGYKNNYNLNVMKYFDAEWVATFSDDKIISISGVRWEPNLSGFRVLFRGATLPGYVKKISKNIFESSYNWNHIELQKTITHNKGPYYITNNVDKEYGMKSYKFTKLLNKLQEKNIVELVETRYFNNVLQNIWRLV